MNALLHAPTSAKPALKPTTNPLENCSALQLDSDGRIQLQVNRQETLLARDNGMRIRDMKFTDFLDPTERQHIESIYLDGIRRGELYQFVDTTLATSAGPRAVTMLLYYHPATQQGWLFIEDQARVQRMVPEFSFAG